MTFFINSGACAMDKSGNGILEEINGRLGKGKVINSSTIHSAHIKTNHFIGVFEDKKAFVSKQFEIIKRIVTENSVTEINEDILQFIKNVGLDGTSYFHKKQQEILAEIRSIFVYLFTNVMETPINEKTTPE